MIRVIPKNIKEKLPVYKTLTGTDIVLILFAMFVLAMILLGERNGRYIAATVIAIVTGFLFIPAEGVRLYVVIARLFSYFVLPRQYGSIECSEKYDDKGENESEEKTKKERIGTDAVCPD